MFELVQAGAQSYYINAPAKIGVYKATDTAVYLIDSGNDKDAGRRVRKLLDENGWTLRGIINTHSNADHIGGNNYLQRQTGCRIFANGLETAFTRHPILEPSFLYGAYPFEALRHKFLMAEGSDAVDISDSGFPKELEVIPLPGHFFDMIGIRTPDDTVFLADCLSSRAVLEKYHIAFIYDVQAYLDTLNRVEQLSARLFVPAHAEAAPDIRALAAFNRDKVHEVADRLLEICGTPLNFEQILKALFEAYALTMSFEQYVLVGSTLRSYLSWLSDQGRVGAMIEDNQLLWQTRR